MAFTPVGEYPIGSGALVQVAEDFTGDGQTDIIVSRNSDLAILKGNGDGSFQPAVSISSTSARSAATGDFNADGKLDLITNEQILLGNGNGTFQTPVAINLPSQTPTGYSALLQQRGSSVAVGDLNQDGKLDLVVTGITTWQVYSGSGFYGPYYQVLESGHANVLLGNGDGSVTHDSVTEYPGQVYGGEAIDLLDVNHDSLLDLIVTRASGFKSSVFLGQNDGSLAPPNHFNTGDGWEKVRTGDFDEDGHVDLLTKYTYDGFALIKGQGDGSFASPVPFTADQSGMIPRSVVVGDVNADGHLDIGYTTRVVEVTEYVPGYWGYYPYDGFVHQSAKVILGNGAGAFGAPLESDLGTEDGLWAELYAGLMEDFDNDGRLDFAATDAVLGTLKTALNDGLWNGVPTVRINDVSITETDSGQATANITVAVIGEHTGITLDFATSDNTAVAGSDYQARAGTLTFAAGIFSRTIEVPITGDRLGEFDESFFVTLDKISGATFGDNQSTVTIVDNEPRVSINHTSPSLDPLAVTEGDDATVPAVFTVTLSRPYDQEITVDHSVLPVNTPDLIANPGTLRFAPGETTKNITVNVVGDALYETSEDFSVVLANPSPNVLITSGQGYGIIQDNDPTPSISIGDASVTEGNSGSVTITFTVSLSTISGADAYVYFASSDGTASTADVDYAPNSGYVVVSPGQTTRTISFDVYGDNLVEPNETFSVSLADPWGVTIADGQAVGTILDDDTGSPNSVPAINVSDVEILEGNKATQLMAFTVRLSQASNKEVRVNYGTANGTANAGGNDYLNTAGTLRFAPGETTQTVVVKVKGDRKIEENEYFYLNLASALNGQIVDGQGVGTIVNDDLVKWRGNQTIEAATDAALLDLFSPSSKRRR